MTTTIYEDLLPPGVLFNLKEIEQMNLIKVDMAKKLISKQALSTVRVGKKIHISRQELIRFLQVNTFAVAS
ncbi:MAG: DNA-binding protein [Sulfuricurvum sp.]|jgi:hypothetical protein|nr:DNA-binding protein [Sulfuricurvum sp.]